MLHRPEFMRSGATLLQKEGMWSFANEKLKNFLAVPSHRPNVPGHQKKGRIRIVHLGTAQTFLEAGKMLECHDAFC